MAKPEQLHLILIRAGSTAWDEAGRIVGNADLPMTDRGRADVEAALEQLDGMKLAAVLAGTDEASGQTAQAAARLAACKPRACASIDEVDLGLWEGLMPSEAEGKYPTVFRQWSNDPTSVVPPDGEPLSDAEDRIITGLAKALDKIKSDGEPVVGIVLRPIALGVVRTWLTDGNLRDLWDEMERCETVERHVIRREAIVSAKDRAPVERAARA